MRFQNIIFDLDGTIADTLPLCIAAFKKSVEPLLNASISETEIVATFGPSEEGTIRRLIPEHEEAGVKAYLQYYAQLHGMCAEPFEGIGELLKYLRDNGVKLAMVTGKGIHSTQISLKQLRLAEYFDIMETGSPEGPDKIKGIRKVLNRLGVSAKESLYVGDAPSDILYCREVGIQIAAAAWATTTDPKQLMPLKPDWIFYTVQQFKEWLIAEV